MSKTDDGAVMAAIAMALHEYRDNNVHYKEPGFITITQHHTLWNARMLQMTKCPQK